MSAHQEKSPSLNAKISPFSTKINTSKKQLMPDAVQFVIRSIILSDDARRQAYTEAQLRLIRDNTEVIKRVEIYLQEH